jgi:hypothetical protein
MWRTLCDRGLRRCLFGVESGVTSILERFNKETTAEQNALAIRTLSALGVPTRFTYITFDHLMTAEELAETRDFQARTDLLIRPLPQLPVEAIVDGVHDPRFVAEHALGKPFYTGISYMLVSMECLIGAAYTKQVQAAGLAGAARPSMGRVDARFSNWRIGVLSEHAQLWVDRNFALDYTLKSLEKILDGPPRTAVRAARVVIKNAAFQLLDDMVRLAAAHRFPHLDSDELAELLSHRMDRRHADLRDAMTDALGTVAETLPQQKARLLQAEYRRWVEQDRWSPINAADPCGT